MVRDPFKLGTPAYQPLIQGMYKCHGDKDEEEIVHLKQTHDFCTRPVQNVCLLPLLKLYYTTSYVIIFIQFSLTEKEISSVILRW